MKKTVLIICLFMLAVSSCRETAGQGDSFRAFPRVQVPSVYREPDEIADYALEHWWDAYFEGYGVTDSAAILGVRRGEVEQALSDYLGILERRPVPAAQGYVGSLFSQIEKCQEKHPQDSLLYLRFTELVADYLYDPNSPLRSEDLFLPFVRGLAASTWTREDMRPGYEYQARMCALNQYGQLAPDFSFMDADGAVGHLYGLKGDNVLMFFSNPGCEACREIVEELDASPWLHGMIDSGCLTVLDIYIDGELQKWRESVSGYPDDWIVAYDNRSVIRNEQIYDVRAIPSLYVLDGQKRIMLKDAPVGKVLAYLNETNNQYHGNDQQKTLGQN